MKTEKRLIDANELRKLCDAPHWCVWLSEIDDFPTTEAVELPCKIGDRVWAIRSYKGHKHPQDGIVNEMYFTKDMRLHIAVKHIARGEWGKTIFATREDAVSAIIGERKDND